MELSRLMVVTGGKRLTVPGVLWLPKGAKLQQHGGYLVLSLQGPETPGDLQDLAPFAGAAGLIPLVLSDGATLRTPTLVEVVGDLIEALSQSDEDEDGPGAPQTYLDGSPR